MVSIDFRRRNLPTDPVAGPDLATVANLDGTSVDLRRVFSERTEYGQDWYVPSPGSHPSGGLDRGGQELGDVVPTGVHRPRHPRWPRAGVRD